MTIIWLFVWHANHNPALNGLWFWTLILCLSSDTSALRIRRTR